MTKIKTIQNNTTEVRLTNKLKVVCDWIDPWTLAVIGGRGLAKSQEIQAERVIKVVEDMPGAPLAFICDTYINLSTNILPAVKLGMRRKGYHEGIHYVYNKKPPVEWLRKCSVIVDEFNHTITFYNGTIIFLGSLDRPSLLAGKSVVHIFSDEAKYQPDKKIDNAFPILRGDVELFGHSVYFLGITATTDMPDVSDGEYDWILRFVKDMDLERMRVILNTFSYLNTLRIKLYNELNAKRNPNTLKRLSNEIEKWEYNYDKVRHNQTFFIAASSLVNIQHLTIKYIKGLLKTLEPDVFNKSVLSIRPTLNRKLRFYPNLSERHFYTDGIDYKYYDSLGYTEPVKQTSKALRHIDKSRKLDIGVDFGNMKSLVVGQEDGKYYRLLKFLYTLSPESYRELADAFLLFFRTHEEKEIDMYYDRQGNNYRNMKEDAASKLKEALEKDSAGNRTGWKINLKSIGQGNIAQELEYEYMLTMLKEETAGLPKLRIDAINCKEVKSSLERAKAIVKYKKQIKYIAKDKSSEKLPLARLPMESTNPSDAVKYLLYRRKWIDLTKPNQSSGGAFIPAGIS